MSDITTTKFTADQLKTFVERIERLEEEKSSLSEDIKEIYTSADNVGFKKSVVKKIVALRKKDAAERATENELLAVYMHALGMEQ